MYMRAQLCWERDCCAGLVWFPYGTIFRVGPEQTGPDVTCISLYQHMRVLPQAFIFSSYRQNKSLGFRGYLVVD